MKEEEEHLSDEIVDSDDFLYYYCPIDWLGRSLDGPGARYICVFGLQGNHFGFFLNVWMFCVY